MYEVVPTYEYWYVSTLIVLYLMRSLNWNMKLLYRTGRTKITIAISTAATCMKSSHLRMLIYHVRFSGSTSYYDGDNLRCEPYRMIVDNEAVTSMEKFNKDTAGNRHKIRHNIEWACFWVNWNKTSTCWHHYKIRKCH